MSENIFPHEVFDFVVYRYSILHNEIYISKIETIDKDFKVDQSNLYDPLI